MWFYLEMKAEPHANCICTLQCQSEDVKLLHTLQNIIRDCRGSFQIKWGIACAPGSLYEA